MKMILEYVSVKTATSVEGLLVGLEYIEPATAKLSLIEILSFMGIYGNRGLTSKYAALNLNKIVEVINNPAIDEKELAIKLQVSLYGNIFSILHDLYEAGINDQQTLKLFKGITAIHAIEGSAEMLNLIKELKRL